MLPKTVSILGVDYQVKLQEQVIEDDEALDGFCDTSGKIIYVRNDEPEEVIDTFVHEGFHAVFYESFIHFIIPSDVEEILIRHLCKFLKPYLVIKQNQDFTLSAEIQQEFPE